MVIVLVQESAPRVQETALRLSPWHGAPLKRLAWLYVSQLSADGLLGPCHEFGRMPKRASGMRIKGCKSKDKQGKTSYTCP